MSLVVWEGHRLVSYAHFGTGNYHPVTARVHTDLSLFTADRALCRDAARVFNYMIGHAPPTRLSRLHLGPHDLRTSLLALIEDEIVHVRAGRPGTI